MALFARQRTFEVDMLARIIAQHQHLFRHHTLAERMCLGQPLPVKAIELGARGSGMPTVLFVGGIHGVERIGSQVVLSFLSSLLKRLDWDVHLQQLLQKVRIAFVPIANPVGVFKGTRGNGNNVDLMRNAPLSAIEPVTFMVGGQSVSKHLPWYRGQGDTELETQVLIDYVQRLIDSSSSLISLDVHSGFGLLDHLWFPNAYTKAPFAGAAYVQYLKQLFDAGYPHHSYYQCAPQSQFYRTHGDLWDYIYQQNMPASVDAGNRGSSLPKLVPLTLEMGSWAWVKKNPRQVFNFHGYFNPQQRHRHQRILRRHITLMQFLLDAACSEVLEKMPNSAFEQYRQQAHAKWYKR
ncbi:DUF2817 domain-containing protein [Shewanella sp. WXL01]|uniref:M14 family zinc carboxypeptidase n=1 Tax=Shewanella sp. WXL01 TaxID=2709721 RepID=UPI00143840CA|nr:M14 family zinc carboxypeptidase [Shewanella sp. WXL01]NKF49845.1 DUF2817 domain-containing protein [Shewanella sp. WXL01]